jgi:hypothetical protein
VSVDLLHAYPVVLLTWGALLLGLAYWTRRARHQRTLVSLAGTLVIATIGVAVGDVLICDALRPPNLKAALLVIPTVLIMTATLVFPAGAAGAGLFAWVDRRGARWITAYGAGALIAVVASALVLPVIGLVLLFASGLPPQD